jgi:putative lipoic acid-binding regulatory protein
MPYFQEILAAQPPFPFDSDEAGRVLFSCNFDLKVYGSTTHDSDIAQVLLTLIPSLTLNTTLFLGPRAILDDPSPTPIASVILTGGISPDETHNGSKGDHPSVQIITRAVSYEDAQALAMDIYHALDGVRNLTI